MSNILYTKAQKHIYRITEELNKQIQTSQEIVNIALSSYRSSMNILDITRFLRIASLNIFIKTEKNHSGINVFTPVSQEFMHLVKNYENLTKEFGKISTEFVYLLIEHSKNIRKLKLFFTAVAKTLTAELIDRNASEQELEAIQLFMQGKAERYRGYPAIKAMLEKYNPPLENMKHYIAEEIKQIRNFYMQLKMLDKQLSNLSNIGEYAAHLAKIEASRIVGREDLLSAFDEIHALLNQSLAELDGMRTHFRRIEETITALTWGAS